MIKILPGDQNRWRPDITISMIRTHAIIGLEIWVILFGIQQMVISWRTEASVTVINHIKIVSWFSCGITKNGYHGGGGGLVTDENMAICHF